MLRIITLALLTCFLLTTNLIAAPAIGNHYGELKNLEIKVVYKNPMFYTPEGLAGYYIGMPMDYEVKIKNCSNRTYNNIEITAIQEYYDSGICNRWWWPYPLQVTFNKGDPMPGDATQVWTNLTLRGNEELVLTDDYFCPMSACDGLDQTHVIIKHINNGKVESAIIYYNPECGIYCPPPPLK